LKIVIAEPASDGCPTCSSHGRHYRKFLDARSTGGTHGGLALTMRRARTVGGMWATFQTDHAGLRMLDALGDDRVMWASDYRTPMRRGGVATRHRDNFKNVPHASRRRILCDNARELYGL